MEKRIDEYFPIKANVVAHVFSRGAFRSTRDWIDAMVSTGLWRDYVKSGFNRQILGGLNRELLQIARQHNLVVTAGKNETAKWFIGTTSGTGLQGWQYCGVGTSTQAPAVGDTDLIAALGTRKIFVERFTITGNQPDQSFFFPANDTQWNGTWGESVLALLTSGVPIFARALFTTPLPVKDSTKNITVDWSETLG